MQNRFQFLPPGSMEFSGIYKDYLDFTFEKQLLNQETWADFVRVFKSDSDDADKGWRCEYWGKMMRGACLCYRATGSEELYEILKESVEELLKVQRSDGRFSTYSKAAELNGWDLWGRKYVMTGLMHFSEICADKKLNARILDALKKHADAIIETVGEAPEKANITETSDFWGGVNSCSILEPFMALYELSKEERYLTFAKYILSTGGCRDGNLIEIAKENKIPPYEYPEIKAYETMSFFEGVLSYYQVTKEEEYLLAAMNFFDAVVNTDLTIIGCCGCKHEQFDNSGVRQIEPSTNMMQETCVSVTWMRLCAKLLLFTGNAKYYGFIERTGYNAMYGAVNLHDLPMFSREKKSFLKGLPFDSYSPLTGGRRGVGIGGFKEFSFGGFYGCCACIASAGIALLPLTAVMQEEDTLIINAMFAGKVTFIGKDGRKITVDAASNYPKDGRMLMTFSGFEGTKHLSIKQRIPTDLEDAKILVNGGSIDISRTENGYVCLNLDVTSGDKLEIKGKLKLVTEKIKDSLAFRYGPLVLARDEEKEPAEFDETPVFSENISYKMLVPESGELVRMEIAGKSGAPVLFTDYASCGKHWDREKNKVIIWMKLNL